MPGLRRPAVRVLATDGEIRAYVHPVRMRIVQSLAGEPRTVTAVAREMGVHPANVTHHFKRLAGEGLIRLVETRDTGRNLEKYYRATARSFVVQPRKATPISQQALALSILRDNLQAAIDGPALDGREKVLALLASIRLHRRDRDRFLTRLQSLLRDFRKADVGGGTSYTLGLSLYPDGGGSGTRSQSEVRLAVHAKRPAGRR